MAFQSQQPSVVRHLLDKQRCAGDRDRNGDRVAVEFDDLHADLDLMKFQIDPEPTIRLLIQPQIER